MRKKIVGIIIFMLLIITYLPLSVLAGDPENPEIIDDEGDVIIPRPNVLNILTTLKILEMDSLDFLDIYAAWFFENPTEPEYLFASIKLKDLTFTNQRVIYSLYWTYNSFDMSAFVHVLSYGEYALFVALNDNWGVSYRINGSFDIELNLVTFEIPKTMVGDPNPGDSIINPSAWAGLRLNRESYLTAILFGELALDYTGDGKNYIIQY
jgi:hypothetical protein